MSKKEKFWKASVLKEDFGNCGPCGHLKLILLPGTSHIHNKKRVSSLGKSPSCLYAELEVTYPRDQGQCFREMKPLSYTSLEGKPMDPGLVILEMEKETEGCGLRGSEDHPLEFGAWGLSPGGWLGLVYSPN